MTKRVEDYTPEQIANELAIINNMSHAEMARLWRFAPGGHIYFHTALPFYDVFKKRFDSFGGMTPEISKLIGWEK